MNLRLLVSILVLTATVSRINSMDDRGLIDGWLHEHNLSDIKDLQVKTTDSKKTTITIPSNVKSVNFTDDGEQLVVQLRRGKGAKSLLYDVLFNVENNTLTSIDPKTVDSPKLDLISYKIDTVPQHLIKSKNSNSLFSGIMSRNKKFLAALFSINDNNTRIHVRASYYCNRVLEIWNLESSEKIFCSDKEPNKNKLYAQINFNPSSTLLAVTYLTRPCDYHGLRTKIHIMKLDK